MKKYKCVIFDLDGTMLDTEKMNMIPLQKLIKEELGINMEYEKILKFKPYKGEDVLKELGFKDIEKSYAKWVQYVNEYEDGAKLYDGFVEVVQALDSKNIICGIASSKSRKQYNIDFIKTGLDKYMKSVVLADDTEKHKPHPDPILKAIELLDIEPKDAIYIGDTIYDSVATKAAGMDFGLCTWDGASKTIEAEYYFEAPKDILKLLGE